LSDQLGRKPVLLAALLAYVVASIGCALATSIEMLIVLRGLQAIGVAGAPVLARAVVRDLYEGARAGREFSRMGSVMALSPVVAITLYIAGLGLAMPQCMAGALTPFPDRAGSASSLLGFLQQVIASSIGIAVGQVLTTSALPLAAVIAVMGCFALALALVNLRMRHPPRKH
jgi:MFS family permease